MAFHLVVTIEEATDISYTHARVHGTFTEYPFCYAGFEWKKGLDGDVYLSWASSYKIGPGAFSATITGIPSPGKLFPDAIYYFRAFVRDGSEHYFGEWESFRTLPVYVRTGPTINIGDLDATLQGYFEYDLACWAGWEWKEGKSGTINSESASGYKILPEEIFDKVLSGLSSATVYYYRTKIRDDYPTPIRLYYGPWLGFATGVSIAITNPATDIGNHLATLNGEIIEGYDGCTENGFEWRKISSPVWLPNSKQSVDSGGGEILLNLTELDNNEEYKFRCYGKKETGVMFYGEWLYFTTTNLVPVVTTQIATDIEAMSVTGNGTIVSYGDLETVCNERGFEVTYSFSGTLKEYNVWKSYGFTGEIILAPETGLWNGTLEKSYEESGEFSLGVFNLNLDGLISNKTYLYRARAKNSVGWGYGDYLEFPTDELLSRKACTLGIWTILLCAYVKPIPLGSIIKRRGFRWGSYETAQEYDIHEDGDFSASATIGPVNTISFINSADDNVYDTIIDSAKGFVTAGFVAGKFINVSIDGAHSIENEGQFKIIEVSEDGGTITVSVRNTLVSEAVMGVTIVDLFALYIVDLDPETDYYSVAYVAIEDSEGNWTVQEGEVAMATTIVNPFEFEGYDKVEFYKPEREQNYKKITRKIVAEVTAAQQYIDIVGGRRFLPIKNHLIQTKENAVVIGTNYKERFKNIKSLMSIEYPTPPPLQREDTLDIGFGRIRFKEDGKGVVNFMPDGEGLMLFRYRMIMIIRKLNMGYTISKEDIDYMATMELEEA